MKEYLIKKNGVESGRCLTVRDGPQFEKLDQTDVPFSQLLDICILLRKRHLVITSTSWTDDEKLDLLVDAMDLYDKETTLPDLIVIITGDGKNRKYFSEILEKREYKKTIVVTAWLSTQEYFGLLSISTFSYNLRDFQPRNLPSLVNL